MLDAPGMKNEENCEEGFKINLGRHKSDISTENMGRPNHWRGLCALN